ncbi:MAG TPA: rhomboid family intramembrane serine protease [Polyangiaceae bacterium]|nr:rhomboid family intramembrane serine protease [Polyangiaceae bacterium]
MDDPQISFALPRPGRALKVLLVTVLALGIFNATARWLPWGGAVFDALRFDVDRGPFWQLWRWFSSGLLTNPDHYGHLLFTLLGLYFLAPDLERRWGAARMLRFFALAIAAGNAVVVVVDRLAPLAADARFHPSYAYGASAAIAAIAVAWSRDNADLTVRMMFVFPMRGRWLLWFTLGISVLDLIYPTALPEGVVAPFGGVLVGLAFGGSPSPVRTLYLRAKLALLRRRSGSLSVADVLSPPKRPRTGGPPLRVVPGGLEDALRKRTPPKDKRYLN